MRAQTDAEPAVPAAAAYVRDFVNSVEWQVDEDAWRTPGDLESWLVAHGGERHPRRLDDGDLELARRIREGLREVLLAHAGHIAEPVAIRSLDEAVGRVPVRVGFEPDGTMRIRATVGASGGSPLAVVLQRIEEARASGDWMRLKACSRDSCRWAYWDASRNASGRWCSMVGCGNHVKMRRRNSGAAAADAEIIPADGPRRATLVDVAALAGVSIKTVSNVVTGTTRVAAPTRARVLAAITELDYHPNLAARALASGRG